MDVFLVPVGGREYQLYVEIAHDEDVAGEASDQGPSASSGWVRRQVDRFRQMLADAERERLLRERGEDSGKTGLWRAIMAKVAEAVAEQRLLWHLRRQTAARLVQPDDLSPADALALARAQFAADFAKHRRWGVIDAGIAAITGPLFFFVPGPNLIAYYFVFRAVGHYFSLRGARQGLSVVTWESLPSPHLSSIRSALGLPGDERRARLDQISRALSLDHLAPFVERLSAGRA